MLLWKDQRLYVLGGELQGKSDYMGDIHYYNIYSNQWVVAKHNAFIGVKDFELLAWENNNTIIIYGGTKPNGNQLNRLYFYNLDTEKCTTCETNQRGDIPI